MKVQNIHGPENYNYPEGCKSWLDYWVKKKKKIQLVVNCPACNTTTRQEKVEAAHVQKVKGKDNKEYIVPVCEYCSARDSIFTIDESLLLAVPE
ncbi:MAG: hypothetical protein ACRC9P_06040 [Bacteroides sp.]